MTIAFDYITNVRIAGDDDVIPRVDVPTLQDADDLLWRVSSKLGRDRGHAIVRYALTFANGKKRRGEFRLNRDSGPDSERRPLREHLRAVALREASDAAGSPIDPIPWVTEVHLFDVEPGEIRPPAPGRFESISHADRALTTWRDAERALDPSRVGYFKVSFSVHWRDGAEHAGRLDLELDDDDGSPLRSHLIDYAAYLANGRYAAMFGAAFPPDKVARKVEWGRELRTRLLADRDWPMARTTAEALRNRGDDTPEIIPWRSGRALLAAFSDPPTLRPDAPSSVAALLAALGGAPDWTGPVPAAVVNYVTRAVERDTRTLPNLEDARVIGKKWRDAVVSFRTDRAPPVPTIARRMAEIADDLALAVTSPGQVAARFCPWRSAYFGSEAGRKRLEVDAWRH